MKKLLERWFRVKTKQEALHFRQKLSIIYAVVGWNCFGVLFYMLIKDKIPEGSKERSKPIFSTFHFVEKNDGTILHSILLFIGAAYGLLTGTSKNMHVYQVTGFTLTNDFDVAYKAKVTQIERETEENEKAIAKTDEL